MLRINAPIKDISYPHDCVVELAEIVDIKPLINFRMLMNKGHKDLFERVNRVQVLQDYANEACTDETMKEHILSNLQKNAKKITKVLNEPTFRTFEFFEAAGLPPVGSNIFTSTATADSLHENCMTNALDIMNLCEGITFQHTSTCTVDGFTGASNAVPIHTPVKYDPSTPTAQWKELSWDLAQQFFAMSNHEKNQYTHLYHMGCISQSWTRNPLGNYVSNWKLHEHWNHLMTMAMLWHGIATVKQSGQLVLKVRIWRNAEMHGICSLAAPLFETCQIVDNAKQACSFATVIYTGFKGTEEERDRLLETLHDCMDYNPATIFGSAWFVQHAEECIEFLKEAVRVRSVMIDYRGSTNTVYAVCLQCLHRCWKVGQKRFMYQIAHPLLKEAFGFSFGTDLFNELNAISVKMTEEDYHKLDVFMSSPWMQDNI